MKDLEIIRSLLYSDMKGRLDKTHNNRVNGDLSLKERNEVLVNAIAECCDMSDINSLLSIYSHLFEDDQVEAMKRKLTYPIASIQGTQDYVIGLLTKRIAIDLEIFNTIKLEAPLEPLKHEYKSKN